MEPGTGTRKHLPIPTTGLTTVVEPPEPSLDIVFVHGFTGHPERTWAKAKGDAEHVDDEVSTSSPERPPKMRKLNPFSGSKSSVGHGYRSIFWPRDLLPTTAPDARVLTYGYDTHIRHWIGPEGSHNTVYDIAWDFLVSLEASRRSAPARPIMLIAHSLGGIVVKEMLRRSSMCRLGQKHLRSVYESTIGVIFFGTPHGGADPRRFLQSVAEQVIKAVGFTVNQQIVDALLPSSERLRELRDEFAPMARQQGWAVHSFQEQMGIKPLGGRKVVEDTSSYLNAPEFEVTEHIGQNHMEMCRFAGSHDPEYRKVAAAVSRIMLSKGRAATDHALVAEPAVDVEAMQEILDSLRFEQHDARHHNIKSAHTKTCKWLLKNELYSEWVNPKNVQEHHGFFWIKGKPGTGKSTVMKFLLGNSRRKMKDMVLVSFFFNARGDALECSTVGMYRSLLLQLLEQQPSVQPVLGLDQLRSRSSAGWSLELLKSLFEQAIQSLTSTSVVCFIDALDECPESEVREMVSSFSHLGRVAVSAGQLFKVCFSSRHYPHITIDKKLELVLEQDEGHGEDISHYVASELKIGQTRLADEIREDVQIKSSGIFMWVVLVVQILNKEYDSGQIHKLRRRLKEIPDDLYELFRDILTRDARDGEELILCLQWVLFSQRPLTPIELYYAVLCGVDSAVIQDSSMEEISECDFDRYILNASKGLIETTRSKNRTAQFIHESVREFLLKDGSFKYLVFESDDTTHSFESLGHERLKQCCLAQIDIAKAIGEPESLPKQEEFPFLQYATNNILHHANRAEELGKPQHGFLAEFPTADWVVLSNACEKFKKRRYPPSTRLLYILAEKNLNFLITIHPSSSSFMELGNERYSSPFYAALTMGSLEALKAFLWPTVKNHPASHESRLLFEELFSRKETWSSLSRDSRFDDKRNAYNLMLQANVMLMMFVRSIGLISEKDINAHVSDIFELPSYYKREQVIILLLKRLGEERLAGVAQTISLPEYWGTYPLHQAAKAGYMEVATYLLDHNGLDYASVKDDAGVSVMDVAVREKYDHMVDLFIKRGITLNGSHAHWMARNYTAEDCRLFRLSPLSNTLDLEVRNCHNELPLHEAVRAGNAEAVELFLDLGKTDVNAQGTTGDTALLFAVMYSNIDIIRLLLSKGKADTNAQARNGQTALTFAVIYSNIDITRLLLSTGKADINAQDLKGQTALTHAAIHSKIDITGLLLSTDKVNVDARDMEGRTPLSHAVQINMRNGEIVHGSLEVTELLVTHQADVNSEDKRGKTPLAWVLANYPDSCQVHLAAEVAHLLCDWGAKGEITDWRGRPAYKMWQDYYKSSEISAWDAFGRKRYEEVLDRLRLPSRPDY